MVFFSLGSLVAEVEGDVAAVLVEGFPSTAFSFRASEDSLLVSWVDGPPLSSVEPLLAPFRTVSGSVSVGSRVFELEAPLVQVDRSLSPRALALAVGLEIVASGVPPLPPVEVFVQAGMDPMVPGPFDRARVRDLAGELPWYGAADAVHPLYAFLRRVGDRFGALDFTLPVLAGLEASQCAVVECFVALFLDEGLMDEDDAAVYAASGGWDLALCAVSGSCSGRS